MITKIYNKKIVHSDKYNMNVLNELKFKLDDFECCLECVDCDETDIYELEMICKEKEISFELDSSLNVYSRGLENIDDEELEKLEEQAFNVIGEHMIEF